MTESKLSKYGWVLFNALVAGSLLLGGYTNFREGAPASAWVPYLAFATSLVLFFLVVLVAVRYDTRAGRTEAHASARIVVILGVLWSVVGLGFLSLGWRSAMAFAYTAVGAFAAVLGVYGMVNPGELRSATD